MDQRQTNWQVIQLTQASLTAQGMDARRRTDGRGRRTHGNPRHGYVMFVRPSALWRIEAGSVLLIRQIEVNCGLERNDDAPSSLAGMDLPKMGFHPGARAILVV